MKLLHGDCLEQMKTLEANSVDAIVTDPPYGLSFMGKKWDYDVPSVDVWREAFRVLKPGGYLLSFAGTRTQHRMAVNIEDAGFEIRDMIAWVYGSGFPKSHNIGKAIDKKNNNLFETTIEVSKYIREKIKECGLTVRAVNEHFKAVALCNHWIATDHNNHCLPVPSDYGRLKKLINLDNRFDELIERVEAEREIIGEKKSSLGGTVAAGERNQEIINHHKNKVVDITAPATPEAKTWDGWGTALKPALEPITMARKPLSEKTVAENVLKWGTGGINIDGCRVETDELKNKKWVNGSQRGGEDFRYSNGAVEGNSIGRFPANLIHDGSPEVEAGFPKEKDNSASRFFYCAKASKADRNEGLEDGNKHPTVKPTSLMRYLVRLCTPTNGTVLDPFMGSGSTGKACKLEGVDFIGIEREAEYMEIARARIEGAEIEAPDDGQLTIGDFEN